MRSILRIPEASKNRSEGTLLRVNLSFELTLATKKTYGNSKGLNLSPFLSFFLGFLKFCGHVLSKMALGNQYAKKMRAFRIFCLTKLLNKVIFKCGRGKRSFIPF